MELFCKILIDTIKKCKVRLCYREKRGYLLDFMRPVRVLGVTRIGLQQRLRRLNSAQNPGRGPGRSAHRATGLCALGG